MKSKNPKDLFIDLSKIKDLPKHVSGEDTNPSNPEQIVESRDGWIVRKIDSSYVLQYATGRLSPSIMKFEIAKADAISLIEGKSDFFEIIKKYGKYC